MFSGDDNLLQHILDRLHGVMVSTGDFISPGPSSNLGGSYFKKKRKQIFHPPLLYK